MSNLITDRVAYFLKDYPPFSDLSIVERDQVASSVTVKYAEAGTFIFKEGELQNDFWYVLNQGNVILSKLNERGENDLVDQCEPGDIFGVRSIITGNPYSMSAECVEESLLYAIPKDYFEKLFEANQMFAKFFASGFAAGQIVAGKDRLSTEVTRKLPNMEPQLAYTKDVIKSRELSITETARLMRQHNIGSVVVVNESDFPIGIVTDTDLRNKVLAQDLDASKPITSVMSFPVKTIKSTVTFSEVLMEMVSTGYHHLIMTEDGSSQSRVCGIVSDHDVMISQQNHPAALIKSLKRSKDTVEWREIRDKADVLINNYLDQGLDVGLVANIATKINDTIIEMAIEHALEKYPDARKAEFCWLSLGSEGRGEQLLRTDQDNALVYRDTLNDSQQEVMRRVASHVNAVLIQCGFEECPAEIMARNPKYCQPLSKWKHYFTQWVTSPDPKSVMNATIFFDFRKGYGSDSLIKELEHHLVQLIKENGLFLNFLAQNALQSPAPLSFFRNFLVERSGEHKDGFDIKKRAMMPISDAARLLTLDHHITGIQNTSDRLVRLAELEPNNAEIFRSASKSYGIFVRQRAINGFNHHDSGRFVDLDQLSKLDKQILKNAFISIKELQDIIRIRFQQAYFS